MLKYTLLLLTFAFALQSQAGGEAPFSCPTKGLVALVPGTFNSDLPGSVQLDPLHRELEINPYFSIEILKTFQDRGYGVMVIKKLDPFGDLTSNGVQAGNEIANWYSENCSAGTPIFVVAHSAGGFYALKAAELHSDLPIKKIVMIAVPLLGAQLANKVFHSFILGSALRKLIRQFDGLFDLRGLEELTSENVERFLDETPIPVGIEVYSSYGFAPVPSGLREAFLARYLSPFFAALAIFVDGDSDGVIEVPTAIGRNATIRFQSGELRQAKPLADSIRLDHTKQVMDYRVFGLLGTRNTEFIREEQHRFYSHLL
jgi:hypothetical protein